MYGTIARMHPLDGHDGALRALQEEWNVERRPKAPGAGETYLFTPDENPYDRPTTFMIALFDTESNYRANADDPEQDAWYRRLRAHLADDPDWMDGTFEKV
jgi:hypothetical protein